jgi:amidophosphoribosyltransferase
MSELIKHECGIAQLRLLKPLSYYKEKYGTAFYGINKMYLMLEKQHNRGQDGAGFASIKLDMAPGYRYISRYRSNAPQPIQDVFETINNRINKEMSLHPEYQDDVEAQKQNLPYLGELMLGHVRYGTYGKNSIESVHPFLRQNNWMHRNLILAGNFNMTNVNQLFENLVRLGQHPKEKADTITVMEKIGHFLDSEVRKLYKSLKEEGYNKQEASPHIVEQISIPKILKKSSKDWDGGYVMAGLLGHGDAFVLRDPSGIRPAFYYKDDEVVVVASERPVIQTAFNVKLEDVKELEPGKALITRRNGKVFTKRIIKPLEKRACSFERIYFSRGNDAEIYQERKTLGRLLMPKVLKAINYDTENSVFSYIPNTAETSFFGMVEAAQDELNRQKNEKILAEKDTLTDKRLAEILSQKLRTEKIAVKDAKLRTFITEDSSRDDLVAHVYDVAYGLVKPEDNLIVIDDSIVRGTTLKKSIITNLDRLKPKQIIIVSSAPQIRYPDCYGIDMARLEDFIAFRAAEALHHERGTLEETKNDIYQKCLAQDELSNKAVENYVKAMYAPFTDEEISDKIAELISNETINAKVKVIYQTVEDLHKACPNNKGDWYFTGDYPTVGGSKIVNKAFVNYVEGNKRRAY